MRPLTLVHAEGGGNFFASLQGAHPHGILSREVRGENDRPAVVVVRTKQDGIA